ncbi:DUF4060 family protein [Salmonella enterica]|nr:DUF4060 family protein [Salmonella enterica]EHF0525789.1 DUF4060 family protein [Salmonella enterica]
MLAAQTAHADNALRCYGRSKMKETYTVRVEGVKVWVEVVNRKASYVATAMTGMRRLRALPGQVA